MRPRNVVLSANATTGCCSFSECDYHKLLFQWMRPQDLILSMNATTGSCSFSDCYYEKLFFSECDDGILFFQRMRLRDVILSVSANATSGFSECCHSSVYTQWTHLLLIFLFICAVTANILPIEYGHGKFSYLTNEYGHCLAKDIPRPSEVSYQCLLDSLFHKLYMK
jgi:hypothetical protein